MARASLLLTPLVSENCFTLPWVISSSTDSILKSLGCQLWFTLTKSLNEWMNDEWVSWGMMDGFMERWIVVCM